jgi:hypothetical protein
MPFNNSVIYPFTKESVQSINPGQIGVYGVFKNNTWIYIGRGDIRQRLLDHLNGDIPCILSNQPTSWIAEVTSNDVAREKQLLSEFITTCNQRVG